MRSGGNASLGIISLILGHTHDQQGEHRQVHRIAPKTTRATIGRDHCKSCHWVFSMCALCCDSGIHDRTRIGDPSA
jgi:hypothetical protein